jgi:hypothetical protein
MAEIKGDLGPFRVREEGLIALCSDFEKLLSSADASHRTKFELSVKRKDRYGEQCSSLADLRAFLVKNNALPIKAAHSFSLKLTHGERSIEVRGESDYADYFIKGAKDSMEAESYRTVLRNWVSKYGVSRLLTEGAFALLMVAPLVVLTLLSMGSLYGELSPWTLIQQDPVLRPALFVAVACYLTLVAYSLWAHSFAAVNPEICFRHTVLYIDAAPSRSAWGAALELIVGVIAGLIAWLLTIR